MLDYLPKSIYYGVTENRFNLRLTRITPVKPAVSSGKDDVALGEERDNYHGSYKIDTSLLVNISTTFAFYKN